MNTNEDWMAGFRLARKYREALKKASDLIEKYYLMKNLFEAEQIGIMDCFDEGTEIVVESYFEKLVEMHECSDLDWTLTVSDEDTTEYSVTSGDKVLTLGHYGGDSFNSRTVVGFFKEGNRVSYSTIFDSDKVDKCFMEFVKEIRAEIDYQTIRSSKLDDIQKSIGLEGSGGIIKRFLDIHRAFDANFEISFHELACLHRIIMMTDDTELCIEFNFCNKAYFIETRMTVDHPREVNDSYLQGHVKEVTGLKEFIERFKPTND